MSTAVAEFVDRLAETRRQLALATNVEGALVALSMADTEVLRAIEARTSYTPGTVDTLRERIAAWHVTNLGRQTLTSSATVTPDVVAGWARGCLDAWFAGITDADPALGGQFHIERQERQDGLVVFEVSTIDGYDPRRFVVTVNAEVDP